MITGSDVLERRSIRGAMLEMFFLSSIATYVTGAALTAASGKEASAGILKVAPEAGSELLNHIGWVFGTNVPVLLSFYAIVIGGQIVHSPSAAKTRRTLSFAAELMAAALVPALLLVVAACVADTSRAGALVAIVPAALLTFFLAAQLGQFFVSEPSLRLANAERTRAWSRTRLRALTPRSRRSAWLVAPVTIVAAAALATLLALIVEGFDESAYVAIASFTLVASVLTAANLAGSQLVLTSTGKFDRVLGWVLPSLCSAAVLGLIVTLLVDRYTAGALEVLIVLVLVTLSSVLPARFLPKFAHDWTLRSIATATAARSVSRTHTRAVREILTLRRLLEPPVEAHPQAGDPPSVWRNLVRAVRSVSRDDRNLDSASKVPTG